MQKETQEATGHVVCTYEIKLSDLLAFLEVKGDPAVAAARAFVRIPGGGDYSNTSLDLADLEGGCVCLELTYRQES